MRKFYSGIVAVVVLLSCTSARSFAAEEHPATQPAAPVKELASYENAEQGFKFKYPAGWEEKKRAAAAIAVMFSSPRDAEHKFNETLSVALAKLPAKPPLDALTQGIQGALKAQFANLVIVRNEPATLAGEPGRLLVYTGKRGPATVEVAQVFAVIDQTLYTITLASLPEEYSDWASTFDAIVGSFELKKSP